MGDPMLPNNDGWLGVDVGVWAAILAVAGAIVVFVAGEYMRARRDRLERRRAVLESWLRAVAAWVAEFKDSGAGSERALADVVNSDVLVLSLSRRDSIVAYWMDEMIVELREAATMETGLQGDNEHDARASQASIVAGSIGVALTQWHAGGLRPTDFWVPYKLRSVARSNDLDLQVFARELHLLANLTPFRHRIRDRIAMLILTWTKDTWWLFQPTFGPAANDIAMAMQMRFAYDIWWHRLLDSWRPAWHIGLEQTSRRWVQVALARPSNAVVAWIWRPEQDWPTGASAGSGC